MLDVVLLAALMLSPQQAQRPAPPPKPAAGTAIIRGRITDKETGAPMPRAAVSMRVMAAPGTVVRNLADNDGRFEFLNLPAGRYEISATAGEYRATHQMESFAERPLPPGVSVPFLLRDGEIKANVNIALSRTLAISGRVVDEYGEPLSGVNIRVTRAGGGPGAIFGGSQPTDDRGTFRGYGVIPGQYVVCAQGDSYPAPRHVTTSRSERLVTTCHPSALNESDAQAVSVSDAEVDGIEIRMQRSRSFSISGIAVDSTGALAESPFIALVRYRGDGAGSTGSRSFDGRFLFSGLTPGDYAVQATIGGQPSGPPTGQEQEHGQMTVQLKDSDVEGLVVAMKRPATVHGRIVFEDTPPATRDTSTMTVSLRADSRSGAFAPSARQPARIERDLSFTLSGIFGRHRLAIDGVPRGCVVKAIRYKGEDITEIATEFVTDPNDQIEITLTSRAAIVSGSVTDDSGKPATSVAVLLLPADPQRWTNELSWYRSGFVSRDGRFALAPTRAGDYLIIAIASDRLQGLSRQRATVERLAKYAERVSLLEHDRLTIDLRVVDVPDRR